MSAQTIREAGWYWVKRTYVDFQREDWMPALWNPDCGAWYTWAFSGVPDSEIIAGERLHPLAKARPEILSRMNSELIDFADRWKLDGDYLRCRRCDRACIASRADDDFMHSASCKAVDPEPRPWRSLLTILGSLGRFATPAPAVPERHPMIAMVDAAMVEMANIYPPLKRSECERLIRAATLAATLNAPQDKHSGQFAKNRNFDDQAAPAFPLVPCPVCGSEAIDKQDRLAKVWISKARPAPAVPDAMDKATAPNCWTTTGRAAYAEGWNACRAAMLAAAPEAERG